MAALAADANDAAAVVPADVLVDVVFADSATAGVVATLDVAALLLGLPHLLIMMLMLLFLLLLLRVFYCCC